MKNILQTLALIIVMVAFGCIGQAHAQTQLAQTYNVLPGDNANGRVSLSTGLTTNSSKDKLALYKDILAEVNWSDFVFEDAHESKSLRDLDVFIEENEDLPIKTAQERK